MNIRLALACGVTVVLATPGITAANADEWTCSFSQGVVGDWAQDTWVAHKPVSESQPMLLVFRAHRVTEIKADAAYAEKSGNRDLAKKIRSLLPYAGPGGWAGTVRGADGYWSPLRVLVAGDRVTFIEETIVGNVMTTSLFLAAKSIDGRIAAVHSRHSAMTSTVLMPSQYLGACINSK